MHEPGACPWSPLVCYFLSHEYGWCIYVCMYCFCGCCMSQAGYYRPHQHIEPTFATLGMASAYVWIHHELKGEWRAMVRFHHFCWQCSSAFGGCPSKGLDKKTAETVHKTRGSQVFPEPSSATSTPSTSTVAGLCMEFVRLAEGRLQGQLGAPSFPPVRSTLYLQQRIFMWRKQNGGRGLRGDCIPQSWRRS